MIPRPKHMEPSSQLLVCGSISLTVCTEVTCYALVARTWRGTSFRGAMDNSRSQTHPFRIAGPRTALLKSITSKTAYWNSFSFVVNRIPPFATAVNIYRVRGLPYVEVTKAK